LAIIKRLLCLANSKKNSGRCLAGREIVEGVAGPWIRPVSARSTEEVSEDERQYEDGSDPRLLDVIDIPLLRHAPHACQTENWLLDPAYYWKLVRRADWHELLTHAENPNSLWVNGHKTYHGSNDEIPLPNADTLPRSLFLIHVGQVNLHVFAPSEAFGDTKRRVQAQFQHGAKSYALWVTDPSIEREYKVRCDGHYAIGESCLAVSLGEPFRKSNGMECRYKLVAAIIQRDVGAGA